MALSVDGETVHFYTAQRVKEERKSSISGEVPDIYRKHYFQVSISGNDWAIPDFFRSAMIHAVLSFKKFGSEEFRKVLVTERIGAQRSLLFTKRADFKPLTMFNSQEHATGSILRLEIMVNGEVHSLVQFSLAQLLWDQKYDASITTHIPRTPKVKTTGSNGLVGINLIRGRSKEESFDNHQVFFKLQASSNLCFRILDSKIFAAFSTVGEKGRWSRLFKSDPIRKPLVPLGSCDFPVFNFARGELTGFSMNNPVRITLYGLRNGVTRMLGFCKFTIVELAVRSNLTWHGKHLSSCVTLGQWRTSDFKSSINISFSTFAEARNKANKVFAQPRLQDGSCRVAGGISDIIQDTESDDLSTSSGSSLSIARPGTSTGPHSSGQPHVAREIVRFPGGAVMDATRHTHADTDFPSCGDFDDSGV